jgi:hypothetical protein
MPLREPALPRNFLFHRGGEVKKKSTLRRSRRQSGLPVDKPLDAGFDGLPPFEGAGGDLRRTKALTIAERSTMTGYPVKHDGGLLAAVVMESAT